MLIKVLKASEGADICSSVSVVTDDVNLMFISIHILWELQVCAVVYVVTDDVNFMFISVHFAESAGVCSCVSIVTDDKKTSENVGKHEIRWLSNSRSSS